jgi:hypothetical protein
MTPTFFTNSLNRLIRNAVLAERARCAAVCYVKAYEMNAMGSSLTPGEAAEACAKAIEQQAEWGGKIVA